MYCERSMTPQQDTKLRTWLNDRGAIMLKSVKGKGVEGSKAEFESFKLVDEKKGFQEFLSVRTERDAKGESVFLYFEEDRSGEFANKGIVESPESIQKEVVWRAGLLASELGGHA